MMRSVRVRGLIGCMALSLLALPSEHAALATQSRPALRSAGSAPTTLTARGPRTPGEELWVARYNGPGDSGDSASSLGMSPDGTRVFVTGVSASDYATVAYDSSTGTQLWEERYGSADGEDFATSLGVSPDGTKVFVTGASGKVFDAPSDFATIAYDASTGAQLWVTRYDGIMSGFDFARSLGVTADGTKVLVTGESDGRSTCGLPGPEPYPCPDYATIAYDAATGSQLWVKRYTDATGAGGDDRPYSLGVSPDGATVFVTGASESVGNNNDYATVAYDTSAGDTLWVARYDGPGKSEDVATHLGVSPDGRRVFVTGESIGSDPDYATIAYDATTGATRWLTRFTGPVSSADSANSIGVSPDGTEVFVTGSSWLYETSSPKFVTIAYDASDGTALWLKAYSGSVFGANSPTSVDTSPDGGKVFVTGGSQLAPAAPDFATVAYDASTGAQLWVKRYNGPGNAGDSAFSMGVSPDGTKVFVTGSSFGSGTGDDFATIAYSTR